MPAEHQIDDGAISSLLKGLAALGAMIGGLWMYLRGLSRPKCECKESLEKILSRLDDIDRSIATGDQKISQRIDSLQREHEFRFGLLEDQAIHHKQILDQMRRASAAGAD